MFDEKINSIRERTEVVFLPEMFSTGFSMEPERLAETMDGSAVQWMKKKAAEETVEEIERALCGLSADQREAFLLKYVEELGYAAMAEITGVGVSALKMRVMRACDRLRDLLREVHSA